jgi:hypothetical protein
LSSRIELCTELRDDVCSGGDSEGEGEGDGRDDDGAEDAAAPAAVALPSTCDSRAAATETATVDTAEEGLATGAAIAADTPAAASAAKGAASERAGTAAASAAAAGSTYGPGEDDGVTISEDAVEVGAGLGAIEFIMSRLMRFWLIESLIETPPDEPASSAAATAFAVGAFRGRTDVISLALPLALTGATAVLVIGTLAIAAGAADSTGATATTGAWTGGATLLGFTDAT